MIINLPQGVDVAPNGSATLVVGAIGAAPLRYQWRLNGVPLTDRTNNFLVLSNLQQEDGGSYRVTVWNDVGTETSAAALVRVLVASGPWVAADHFANRPTVPQPQGAIQGSSASATLERAEPFPGAGGRTVWVEWEARRDGIATFTTQGSAFDTLLDVFTGSQLDGLSRVVSDDDGGGHYTSRVRFNAQNGTRYQVRVAGFGSVSTGGEFTLSWDLPTTTDPAPVILSPPIAQGVLTGGNATFKVVAGPSTSGYAWFFNGSPIPGATGSSYTVVGADSADVGLYSVRVQSLSGQSTVTEPVGLQLTSGNAATVEDNFWALLQDKFQNVGVPSANGNRPGAGWFVGLGDSVSTEAYSAADGQEGDPEPCDEPLFGTLYQAVTATDSGVIQVDTIGSAIFARMAVYQGIIGLGETLLMCDLESGLEGSPCVAKFDATDETVYSVVVEGYQGTGTLKLNCKMGVAPPLPKTASYCLVSAGDEVQLSTPATNWCPYPTFQWQRNGKEIHGATDPVLTVTDFGVADQGMYSVEVSNFVRVAIQPVAYLAMAGPFLLTQSWGADEGQFIVQASNAFPFVLETTTNVAGPWGPLATNHDPCVMLVLTNVIGTPQRFFRAVPWP